jgi:uncharacterized GH25 family protein
VLGATASASAHQIWIEQDAKTAKVYFGEFGENLREASPGLLDKFGSPTARTQSGKGDQNVALAKEANAFVLAARAGKGEAIVVEDAAYPIIEWQDGGKTKRKAWTPAARFVSDFAERAPKLTLDVLPTGKPGELRVVFRDRPLAQAKVELVTPSGWMREGYTDEQGKVTFPMPWRGAYVALVHHDDDKPGKRTSTTGEQKFDAASFATTLSFTTRSGTAGPPAPPPAPPNK